MRHLLSITLPLCVVVFTSCFLHKTGSKHRKQRKHERAAILFARALNERKQQQQQSSIYLMTTFSFHLHKDPNWKVASFILYNQETTAQLNVFTEARSSALWATKHTLLNIWLLSFKVYFISNLHIQSFLLSDVTLKSCISLFLIIASFYLFSS